MALTKITVGGIGALAVDTAELAADAVESAKIADGQVDTEHLADDAVDSEELAPGAIDAGHFASGVGGWVKLQSTTVSSTTATVAMETGISSTYDHYMITMANIHMVTDAQRINFQLKIGGAYEDGDPDNNYSYHTGRHPANSTGHEADQSDSGGHLVQMTNTIGIDTSEMCSMTIYFSAPSSTDNVKELWWNGTGRNQYGVFDYLSGGGGYDEDNIGALTGIQFLTSSGGFASGIWTLYGLSK